MRDFLDVRPATPRQTGGVERTPPQHSADESRRSTAMHETVFDHLSRSLGAGVSRRKMVRVVAGGALSLGLGHLALDDVDAKKHRRRRKKRKRRADDGSTSVLVPTPPGP